jgi:hypothetical protein
MPASDIFNRTFAFYGLGYGASPVTLTVTFNGNQVFSGTVPTVDQEINGVPAPAESDLQELFRLVDLPALNTSVFGLQPMSITVAGGRGVLLHRIKSATTGQPLLDLTKTAFPEPRQNVRIDGVLQGVDNPTHKGTWSWFVPAGSTIEYDLDVPGGVAVPSATGSVV